MPSRLTALGIQGYISSPDRCYTPKKAFRRPLSPAASTPYHSKDLQRYASVYAPNPLGSSLLHSIQRRKATHPQLIWQRRSSAQGSKLPAWGGVYRLVL